MQKVWHILLVDDDEDDYLIIREMLRATHAARSRLTWAKSFGEGKKLLENELYDAVLMDYDLGDGTGIELIRQTVAREYPAPCVLLTGRGTPEVDVEAMEAGAIVYLNKNEINSMLLERTIRYAMERKHIEMQLVATNEQLAKELNERERVERRLRYREEQLSLAYQAADLGIWEHNLVTNRLTLDERAQAHYGFEQDEVDLEQVLEHVHPNDYERMKQEIGGILHPSSNGSYYSICRVIHADGSVHWLSIHVQIYFQAEGAQRRPVRGIGTSQDITHMKLVEEHLEYQSELLHKIPQPVFASDAELRLTYWNEAAATVLGWSEAEALGKRSFELLEAVIPELDIKQAFRILRQQGCFEAEITYRKKDGSWQTFYSRSAALRGQKGEFIGLVAVLFPKLE
jgi:PAS domain S-box-containing protein